MKDKIKCIFCGEGAEQPRLNADFIPQFEVCSGCGAMYICVERLDIDEAVREMVYTTTGLELLDVQINELYELAYTENVDYVRWEILEEAGQIIVWVKRKED